MNKFIKVNFLHPNNIEADGIGYINTVDIVCIMSATPLDRKQRNETRSIVITRTGLQLAVTQTPDELTEAISEALV